MLYAWIGEEKRPPRAKGERTVCQNCQCVLTSVMPAENVPHWRHKAGDCDSWSEAEGPWHLGWKDMFDSSCREVTVSYPGTDEWHRADILCGAGTSGATVLELQHSSISEEERKLRETFYRKEHRMFWLVHLHDGNSFLETNFGLSLDMNKRSIVYDGKTFGIMKWMGLSKQFIEKWKKSHAWVFFDFKGHIFYLPSNAVIRRMGNSLERGEYALCYLTHSQFITAVLRPVS